MTAEGFKAADYCTKGELGAFNKLRTNGSISSFRIALCDCGAEIPNSKKFCSIKCKKKNRENSDG